MKSEKTKPKKLKNISSNTFNNLYNDNNTMASDAEVFWTFIVLIKFILTISIFYGISLLISELLNNHTEFKTSSIKVMIIISGLLWIIWRKFDLLF